MTCKDCVHYEVCDKYNNVYERELSERYCAKCKYFKNKADFVEVKHGEWIKKERKYCPSYICSVCGYSTSFLNGNYCKECGAKMDGKGGIKDA